MLNLIRDKYNKYLVTFVYLIDFYKIIYKEIVLLIILEMFINVYSLNMHNRLHYLYNNIFFINNQINFEFKLFFNFLYKLAIFRAIVDFFLQL